MASSAFFEVSAEFGIDGGIDSDALAFLAAKYAGALYLSSDSPTDLGYNALTSFVSSFNYLFVVPTAALRRCKLAFLLEPLKWLWMCPGMPTRLTATQLLQLLRNTKHSLRLLTPSPDPQSLSARPLGELQRWLLLMRSAIALILL